MEPSENATDEVRRLRRTMRDLVALSTLPAVWIGLGPDGIARSLADVLLNTLSLDLIYVRLAGSAGEGVVEVVRCKHGPDAHVEAVRAALAPLLRPDRADPPTTIPAPSGVGMLHVAVARFGVGDDHGVLVAGSRNADFPTERDRLLLGVGANQTAIVVQRRRAEEALRRSERRFARFMQHLPGLAWIKDSKGRYVYANEAAERAFGTPRERLYGRTDEEVFPPEAAAQFRENDRRALESGAGLRVIETLEHEDGIVHHSLVSKFPIPSPDGGEMLVGGMAIDITDRLEMEVALKEADRRKDEFLATLAHELRNPLAPIRNALHLMRQSDGDGPMEAERAMAERQVVHLARLIDDLMDVARISRGKIELHKEAVDLATVVGLAVETARTLIDERRHRLTVSLPDELIRLEADPTRLEQVLWNLLNNAAKYTEPGGQIALSAEREGGEVVLRVRDNGIGIEAAMLPPVFQMFLQVGEHREHAQGGLGIGLSLVRTLVEMHGGTISAHSGGPGKGSEFVVRLPVLAQPGERRSTPDRDRLRRRRTASRPVVASWSWTTTWTPPRAWLDSWRGCTGRRCGSPTTARRPWPSPGSSCPRSSSWTSACPAWTVNEVARRLRGRPEFEKTLIVALTGWGQEADVERSRAAGFDHHLVKPASPEAILELLTKAGEGEG